MYALKISINGGTPIVAGGEDLVVLNTIIDGTGKLGSQANSRRGDDTYDFAVSVGGLTARNENQTDEHLRWLSQMPLQVGDTVQIEIVETTVVDPVISGSEAKKMEDDERSYFEHCKKAYLDMRNKYESAPE
ncbi:hypothetical protein ACO0LM_23150 [Undibacterium sp. Di26W]|uniref:hypothetical protein n=1 Tax=Undibacterium sp. Di26W TaxID=3413035 RepID=UPI003BF0F885